MSKNKKKNNKNIVQQKRPNYYTIVCVGDQIGKTRLILRYIHDDFDEEHDPTLFDRHKKKTTIEDETVTVDLLDISGSEDYFSLYNEWFQEVDGFLLLYSINNPRSFDLLTIYREKIIETQETSDFPLLLVGTAADDETNRKVTTKEGKSLAYTFSCPFLEVSSKNGEGVVNAFNEIIREIKNHRQKKIEESKSQELASDVTFTNPSIEGFLKKKTGFGSQKLYCVIEDGILYFFKQKGKSRTLKEKLNLMTCTPKPNMTQRTTFDLVGVHGTHTLVAETNELAQEWLIKVQDGIAYLLNQITSGKEQSMNTSERHDLNSVSPYEELRKFPENLYCSDCGAPDPDWISINLGCLICLPCSGVHRSLGVHISKVRSLTLDEWEHETLELMKVIGNDLVNEIWEKRLNEVKGISKPNARSDRSDRQLYIEKKYRDRAFIDQRFDNLDTDAVGIEMYKAIEDNDLKNLLILIANRADVNWKNTKKDNQTPLHTTAENGNIIFAELLIRNNSNLNIDDSNMKSPLDLAMDNGFEDVAELLIRRGCENRGNYTISQTCIDNKNNENEDNNEIQEISIENENENQNENENVTEKENEIKKENENEIQKETENKILKTDIQVEKEKEKEEEEENEKVNENENEKKPVLPKRIKTTTTTTTTTTNTTTTTTTTNKTPTPTTTTTTNRLTIQERQQALQKKFENKSNVQNKQNVKKEVAINSKISKIQNQLGNFNIQKKPPPKKLNTGNIWRPTGPTKIRKRKMKNKLAMELKKKLGKELAESPILAKRNNSKNLNNQNNLSKTPSKLSNESKYIPSLILEKKKDKKTQKGKCAVFFTPKEISGGKENELGKKKKKKKSSN
ncbi:centaurin/arf [Anaeramoeba flamelloides]|uniref:Centaurin/arf n=1 Tax=Anaeramoeba flamelloides TaxID=1746091 RepID=A0AAV8A533_9EUKA|nr:centaurin/arf [Anaeramoeba flamelloides]